jgi:CelD/BcsL family acetyltransferase involved in cellulose biosynthesis
MPQTVLVAPESEKGGSALPVVKAIKGGIEIIDELTEEWRQLCLEGPCDQPFFRPEWIGAYVLAFAAKAKLVVITARIDGRLKAVLPLVEEKSLWCGLPVRRLRGAANWHSGRFDVVKGAGAEGNMAVRAVWSSLKDLGGWDLIELPDVPQGGAAEELLDAAQKDGFAVGRWESMRSPYIPLSGLREGEDPWLSRTSANFRQNMRKWLRKSAAEGGLHLHRLERPDSQALERFYTLECSGWKGRQGTAIASRPSTRSFYDRIARGAQPFDYLCLHILELGQETLAACLGLTYGGKYFFLKPAYDERYAKLGPGHLLINAVLRDCVQRRLAEFDLMGPRVEYKAKWTSLVHPHAFLYVFRNSRYGRLLHTVKFSILPSMKRLLRRTPRL